MCKIHEDSTTTEEDITGTVTTRRKSRTLTDLVTNKDKRKVRRHSEVTRPQAQNLLTHLTHTIFVHNNNNNNNNINSNKERIHSYKSFNILVLGATEVGKTSIIQRFVSGKFTTEYLPTISEEYETGIFLEIGDKLKQFDLVFMDIQMPRMDGIAATHALKKIMMASGKIVPVIALTANAMSGDREKFIGLGLDDYLVKPIVVDDLNAMLRSKASINN